MPARRVCAAPGCPMITDAGHCPVHTRERPPEERPTAARRGYGARWAAYATRYRRENPWCADCLLRGTYSETAAVDHIVPVRGPGDPGFWDRANHQSLCRSCHAAKTAQEGRTQGRAAPPRGWWFA